MTREDENLLRTQETQNQALASTNRNNVNGVKSKSCLDRFKYFKSIDNLPLDAMHDILEGHAQFSMEETKFRAKSKSICFPRAKNAAIRCQQLICGLFLNFPHLILQ